MARITDPDNLSRATVKWDPTANAGSGNAASVDGNVYIDTTNKEIGVYSSDREYTSSNFTGKEGVVMQALYSFLKEQWKSQSDLASFKFPMEGITGEQFEFKDGWVIQEEQEKQYIRSAGWREIDATNTIDREYAGIITLGTIEANHTAYYSWAGSNTTTDFAYDEAVNQAILIYENGGDNNRETVLEVYIRSVPTATGGGNATGFTFDESTSTAIGADALTYQAYRFPLTEANDPKITKDDATVSAYSISVDFQANDTGVTTIDGVSRTFTIAITGQSTTPLEEIYMYLRYLQRQTGSVGTNNTDGVIGKLLPELAFFTGDRLTTKYFDPNPTAAADTGGSGVYIDVFAAADKNDVEFRDDSNNLVTFPFIAAVSLIFNQNVIDDANSKFWLFYTTIDGGYPSSTALLVNSEAAFQNAPFTSGMVGDVHYIASTGLSGGASGTTHSAITKADTTFTVSTESWDATGNGELAGKILKLTNGTNAKNYNIASNTATVITLEEGEFFDSTEIADANNWAIYDRSSGTITFDYKYEDNDEGNGSGNTNKDVTLVVIGLDKAQFATGEGTIIKSPTVNVNVTAPLERNYLDPVDA